ncbi:TetR/AcrR family transcriptional regulator [Caulobacter sp. KR2-114]|uniref:TetR/AcrR family transcriptional regulator n=1 Tax=Caulobacter sp. KR2-114 TaxID=3400912 RepID=UPI003BFCE3D1
MTAPRVKTPPADSVADADPPAAPETDGRRRRSQDSRARIVSAMLELVHAGDATPGAEQVAARANVGLRTVFRHFSDMDSLYAEMAQVIESELRRVVDSPFVATTWRERMVEMVGRRSAAFDRIAPFRRAADVHRHHSRFLQQAHERMNAVGRELLKRELPAEQARDATLVETLDLLLSFEAWNRLRRDQDLTPRRARDVLEQAIRRAVGED